MKRSELLKKEMEVAEKMFGTQNDPDQIPINEDSVKKLDKLCDGWLESKILNDGDPVSWVVVIPTQIELANKFLNKEISERQLLDLTEPNDKYDAVYLASAITIPEYRGRGYAKELTIKAIENIPTTENFILFSWPWSEEGRMVLDKLSKLINKEIKIRS